MSTSEIPQTPVAPIDADPDALIERLSLLPERESLEFYSQLSPKLQWLARQRTTGKRRKALIAHHAVSSGRFR